ncbi:MAG: type 4a pilus biogenesis protein PilO [Nitrospinaceae bacterium]|nr:type 4a pilus biogenesis protein PilO [Nitrospinaceae bacterium]
MDKIFDRLPYDTLNDVSSVRILGGAGLVALILFLLASFTLFSAGETQIEILAKKRFAAEYTFNKYFQVVASKDKVVKNLSLRMGDLSIQKKQLPKQDALNSLLEEISALGRKRGIDITAFQVSGGEARDFYKEVFLHFTFRGGLWGTMDMFSALQNMPQIVDIKNMTFNVGTTGKDSTLVSAFAATIYIYIEGL